MTKSIDNEIQRIRDALTDDSFKSHVQIYTSLGISPSTYARRLKQIEKEDREAQEPNSIKAKQNKVERIKNALEAVSKVNYNTMMDKKTPPRDKIKASAEYFKSELFIFGNVDYILANLPKVEKFLSQNAMEGLEIGDK
jgi:DNA-binding Lrp family transcriptional regulator